MGAREQNEQSLLRPRLRIDILSLLPHSTGQNKSYEQQESRGGRKRPHLEMEGAVKSHCKGREHKERGRCRFVFVGLLLSLFLDEETEGKRGSETCPRSQQLERDRGEPCLTLGTELLTSLPDSPLCAKRKKKIHFGNSIHQRKRIFKYFDISSRGFCLLGLLCHPCPLITGLLSITCSPLPLEPCSFRQFILPSFFFNGLFNTRVF